MYRVKPIGLNLKDNDRDVPDGFLQESINMQWRDGAFKPIPERIISDINAAGYSNIILHKVGDENTINVVGFNRNSSPSFLAFDLSDYLGGSALGGNIFEWFGTITDGVFTTKTITQVPFAGTPGMSFTILNGLIYFMGDGSTAEEQYYIKLEFDEATGTYNIYDMYAWKELIPTYYSNTSQITANNDAYQVLSLCGIILIRFALVLKSGEVVLHSPIYGNYLYGLTRSNVLPERGAPIKNIHTAINFKLIFDDLDILENEVSAINFYTTTPYYKDVITEVTWETIGTKQYGKSYEMTSDEANGEFLKKAEDLFYLVKTIEKPGVGAMILYVDSLYTDVSILTGFNQVKSDINNIAAGEIMPTDNFSYHKVYGKITSYNGRLVILRPVTILSNGHLRALAVSHGAVSYYSKFEIYTEDGIKTGNNLYSGNDIPAVIPVDDKVVCRGLLSYPDYRASSVGLSYDSGSDPEYNKIRSFKCRKNNSHNMSCAFDSAEFSFNIPVLIEDPSDATKLVVSCDYSFNITYTVSAQSDYDAGKENEKYSSENRIQFSEAGEFKVWPAINSYRIGEGKVINMGRGSVNLTESLVISPLIVGTSDGVYTINLDPTGNNFISSITPTAKIPFISEEILEIDQSIIFVSDKGLMVYSNGDFDNLTKDYFPQQGNGDFPAQETVYPNYNVLTAPFFGNTGNPYELDDIVRYMKSAFFAFDSRRNNVWCSNPAYEFSLIYNLDVKQWGMSTIVFDQKIEMYSIINTDLDGEIYTRFMVKSAGTDNLLILSGEDPTQEVFYHILTRPIKFQRADDYKVLTRMFYRTMLQRKSSATAGYFSIGLWGQQDVDRNKKSIQIMAKSDNRSGVYPGNIRYHIPIDCRKGKYKSISVLQSGNTLPESYISSFDFDIYSVDNTKMR